MGIYDCLIARRFSGQPSVSTLKARVVTRHLKSSEQCEAKLQAPQPRIRVGLLLDDQLAPRWIHETIEQLLGADHVELAAIVFKGRPPARHMPPRSVLFTLWNQLDRWLFRPRDDRFALERKKYPVPTVIPTPVDGKGRHTLSPTQCAELRDCKLDVLVQLGSGDLPDALLECAKYGVWSFRYGRYTEAEPEVALFWNLNAGPPTYDLVLQAAIGNPRHDRVLGRYIFASHSFSLEYNLTRDCRRRAPILLQRLSDLYRRGWAGIVMEQMGGHAARERIDSGSLNRATVSWFFRSLRHLFTRLCFREQWFITCCKSSAPATELARIEPFAILAPPRGKNHADPFLFEHKEKTYIFFERYADDEPGTICCVELCGNGTLGEIRTVLRRSYHVSYPFVFKWHGDIYLLPETSNNGTVEVYGAIDFPHRWELAAVLLRNVLAVDATILEHQGKLWLFAAGLGGLGTESSELSLFFADSLFGQWRPHPKNPVVRDVRRARPAGRLFFQQERLIRPGQDCFERYGYAISLNRVDVLSETDYSETPLTTILPNWMPRLCGTHTLNQQGGFRVLDGKMLVPRWAPAKWSLRSFRGESALRGMIMGSARSGSDAA
jgi:hypothetical protein